MSVLVEDFLSSKTKELEFQGVRPLKLSDFSEKQVSYTLKNADALYLDSATLSNPDQMSILTELLEHSNITTIFGS